ncbi:MAG: hypothetical protein ACI82Q_000590 [Nonlabens sp.]|jgi:hypothetical protein
MSSTIEEGTVKLFNQSIPALTAGNYKIQVDQSVTLEGAQKFTTSQEFVIESPRFTMNTNAIHSVFPTKNAVGDFSHDLPFIVLNDKYQPWVRALKDQNNKVIPWMALLIFRESELLEGVLTGTAFDSKTKAYNIKASAIVNQSATFLGPTISGLTTEEESTACQAIAFSTSTFDKIVPSLLDLNYTAHVKEVDVTNKTLDNGKFYSNILSNRLPITGGTSENYVAHLVSMEGFSRYLNGSNTAITQSNVAMVSLASWTFTSEASQKVSFRSLMEGLVGDKISSTEELLLRVPTSATKVAPPILPYQTNTLTFDGTQTTTIQAASAPSFLNQSPFTIEVWVNAKTTNQSGSNTIISQFQGQSGNNGAYYMGLYLGKPYFARPSVNLSILNGGGTNLMALKAIGVNEWHHISVTYDGTFLSLYVDGVEQVTKKTAAIQVTSSLPTTLGANQNDAGAYYNFFEGQFAGLRLWNVGRTQSEIINSMGLDIVDNSSGLINGISFKNKTGLDNATWGTALLRPTLSAKQKTAEYLKRGYLPRNYETRTGEKTFAWYRGPLIPMPRANSENRSLSIGSQEEALYDPKTGLFDMSNSVAWETGRLLALSDKVFAVQLLNWRRESQDVVDLLSERLASPYVSDSAKDLKTVDAVHNLLENQLLSKAFFVKFINTFNDKIAQTSIDQAVPTTGFTPIVGATPALLLELQSVREYLNTHPNWKSAFDSIVEWLARLALLYGAPFENIVPDEKMLPIESIRFFYLDQDYLDSMIDGALSIGTVSSKDTLYTALMRNLIRDGVAEAVDRYRDALLGIPHRTGTHKGNDVTAGFLIRSSIVADWPGVEIKAYATLQDKTNKNPMKILRFDRISPDVILCILPTIPISLSILEPLEAFRYGVNPNGSIVLKQFTPEANIGELVNSDYKLPGINIADVLPFYDIAVAIKPQLNSGTPFTSASFAFQFTEAPQVMDFNISLTMPVYQNTHFVNEVGASTLVQKLTNQPSVLGTEFIAFKKSQPNTVSFYLFENDGIGGAPDNEKVYSIATQFGSSNPLVEGEYLFNAYPPTSTGLPIQVKPLYCFNKSVTLSTGTVIAKYYSLSNVTPAGFSQANPFIVCQLPNQAVRTYEDVEFSPVMKYADLNGDSIEVTHYRIGTRRGSINFYASEYYRPELVPIYYYENDITGTGYLPYMKLSLNVEAPANGYEIIDIAFYAYPTLQPDTTAVYGYQETLTAAQTSSGQVPRYLYSTKNETPTGFTDLGILFYTPVELVPVYGFVIAGGGGYDAYYLKTSPSPVQSFKSLGKSFYGYKEGTSEQLVAIYLYGGTAAGCGVYRYSQGLDVSELGGYTKEGVFFYAYPTQVIGSIALYIFSHQLSASEPKLYFYSVNDQFSGYMVNEGVLGYVSEKSTLIPTLLPIDVYNSASINKPYDVRLFSLTASNSATRAFSAYKSVEVNTVPVYLYTQILASNGLQLYYYSTVWEAANSEGYNPSHVQFYAYLTAERGTVPVYQFSASQPGTTPKIYYYSKSDSPPNGNFTLDKIVFYAYPYEILYK